MSKKIDDVQEQPKAQPEFLTTLKEKGTVTITSTSRDGLNEMLKEIPSEMKYGVGAVGFNVETRLYSLRLDLSNSKTQ